jgi:preprotein translocase subunit Sss1
MTDTQNTLVAVALAILVIGLVIGFAVYVIPWEAGIE